MTKKKTKLMKKI